MFRLDWNGNKILQDFKNDKQQALQDVADLVLDESDKRVPIDEGILRNSGIASVDENSAVVSYNTPYAIRVHEDTTARHTNGRMAKFLERALNENAERIRELLADRIGE